MFGAVPIEGSAGGFLSGTCDSVCLMVHCEQEACSVTPTLFSDDLRVSLLACSGLFVVSDGGNSPQTPSCWLASPGTLMFWFCFKKNEYRVFGRYKYFTQNFYVRFFCTGSRGLFLLCIDKATHYVHWVYICLCTNILQSQSLAAKWLENGYEQPELCWVGAEGTRSQRKCPELSHPTYCCSAVLILVFLVAWV